MESSTTRLDSGNAWSQGALGFGQWWNAISGKTDANTFTAEQAQLDRDFNAQEAQKARDWEEYMSNTAYTRAVQDIRNAGLNPASLSGLASSGGGASTPSGSAASHSGAAGGASGSGPFGIIGSLVGAVITSLITKSAKQAVAKLQGSSRIAAATIYANARRGR